MTKKKRKGVRKKKLIDIPCETNIYTAVEKHVSSKKIYILILLATVSSTCFQQIVKQIEVIQKVVLPEVSKLNKSVMNKNQGDQIQFSPEKKTLENVTQQYHSG